jgi:hypothetical protein
MIFVAVLLCVVALVPVPALAIIPPDVIVSVGSNLLQIIGVIALALGSIYTAVIVLVVQGVGFFKRYAIAILPVVTILAAVVVYVVVTQELDKMAVLEYELVTEKDRTMALLQENALLRNGMQSATTSLTTFASTTPAQLGRNFYSESYTVVSDSLVIEIDTNRIETAPGSGVFVHYTYLNGNDAGTSFTEYATIVASSSTPIPHSFVNRHIISNAEDLSPRDTFSISLTINGKPVTIEISNVAGDFVTRDELSYTRTHSLGRATITMDGTTIEAPILVDRAYSNDADYGIFFPGHETIDVKTVQFILWDTEENFYLFDSSNVSTPSPYYRSHTWLLYKGRDGYLKKSFSGTSTPVTYSAKLAWNVAMPEFNDAVFAIEASEMFKSQDGRIRVVVSGTVQDARGVRNVRGVGHLIN